jgi:hypothetical protein
MDNKNVNDSQEVIKNTRGVRLFWLTVSGIFFIISIALAWLTYKVVNNTQENLASTLKSFSIQLSQNKEEARPVDNLVRRYIDGVLVEPGQENIFPVAIVIDNHPDARPPEGLAQANLVYEAEAEGVTTRYLAIFADNNKLDIIGPVRSARPYFLDWARELSALFAHCGGSPEALVKIKKDNIFDLNEFYQGQYFWRADDRAAPHNVMTSTDKLRSFLMDEDSIEGKYFSWNFKDDEPAVEPASQEIIIPEYSVRWVYNKEENNYIRFLGEQEHLVGVGGQIKAKNIIIIFTPTEVIDEELRVKIETIGTGQAVVCLDGVCREGQWSKKSAAGRTRFYDTQGEEFVFNAGPTWIEVVRPGFSVSY